MKKMYLLLAVCVFSLQGYAQPGNDDCANAVTLTVNANNLCGSIVSGTLTGATDSGEGDNGTGVPNDDVWYTFVATSSTHIFKLLNITGSTTDLVHEVLEGNCDGGLTSLNISDPESSVVGNLTVGTTYFIRVFSYQDAPSVSTNFSICVGSPPAPPANDDCNAAVSLMVNANNSCATVVSGTLSGATDSGEGDNGAGVPNDDVWYTFVATSTAHILKLLNVTGETTNLVHEVLEGNCDGGLASLNISDPDSSIVYNLTVGTTYYIRVFSNQQSPSVSTNFSICVGTPPVPPANDGCSTAVGLTVNANNSCAAVVSGTLSGATDSGEGDNGAGVPNDDVWYTFVATSTTHILKLLNVTGETTDLVHEVLEGNCDGGLTSLNISDPDSSVVYNLTVGTTYYIRVFSYQQAPSVSTNFSICIGNPPATPANDDCSGAVELTVNADNLCATVVSGTLSGATDSNEVDNGAGVPNDDVWYTFVATSTTHILKLLNVTGETTDLVHEVLEGNCNEGFESISISDPDMSFVNNLTIGTTYYIRVFSYQSAPSVSTNFSICVGTPPAPPVNDDCNSAVGLTVNADNLCASTVSGTLSGATDSGITNDNTGVPNDDVWYTFVATSTTHILKLLNVTGETTDLVHEVFEGTCDGAFNSLIISDLDGSVVYGLTVGTTYYVRVYSYQSTPSISTNFSICVGTIPAPPVNDDCNSAVGLTVNADNLCASTVSGTLSGATDSNEGNNGTGVPNDDVWYTFVATSTTHVFRLLNVTGETTDLVHEVLEGSCDGNLASLGISDPNTSVVNDLTIGTTYYIRVFSYQTIPSISTNFSICVGTIPAAPVNDDCNAAISLTVNADDLCASVVAGTLSGATDSNEGDNGAGVPNDDVWYTFVATNEIQIINLFNVTGETTDLVHEVLEGTCDGGLDSLNVSDSDSSIVTDLTIGTTYYVRVFSYQETASISTNFYICVGTPPPAPVNDDCIGAIALITGTNYNDHDVDASVSSATDSDPDGDIPNSSCSGYEGGDIWFTATIPASGNLTIQTGPSSGNVDSFDSVMIAYSGTCNSLQPIDCIDDYEVLRFSKVTLNNRTPGEVVYIRIYEYNNDETEPFSISAFDATLVTPGFDASSFKAYPNPVTDVLNLSYTKDISNVEVFNVLGQQILIKTVNNREDKLDMSQLATGTYLVKVTAEGQTKTIKVLKK